MVISFVYVCHTQRFTHTSEYLGQTNRQIRVYRELKYPPTGKRKQFEKHLWNLLDGGSYMKILVEQNSNTAYFGDVPLMISTGAAHNRHYAACPENKIE